MDNLIKPTESELEILQILWECGPSTVRCVHEELAKTKAAGYTTTLKLMQIMHEKGLVYRDTSNRSHVYSASVSREKTSRQIVDRLVNTLFKGSSSSLVMQALGNHKASAEEIRNIKKYLNEIERKEKESK